MKPRKELESPFLVKQWPIELSYSSTLDDLYRFTTTLLDSSESVQEVWVSSEVPFVIKLKLADIQEAVKGGKLDSDCLNLAIRNMATEDVENYQNKKCLGWRHHVDSDWTVSLFCVESFFMLFRSHYNGSLLLFSQEFVARDLDQRNTTYLQNIFCRQPILYNASDSHLVLIPVFIPDEHWTLYAFNMSDRKLSILDSLPDPAERHEQIRLQVCGLLNFTMDTAFDMSENDFRSWTYEFPEVPRQHNSYDCGFFMFNFMRLWDGDQLVQLFPTESRELRKDFLAYILSCKDNRAKLPPRVSRWITSLSEETKLARKDRQSWARYPMHKRLLKAAREGDVEAFGVGPAADEGAIGIIIRPEPEAIAGTNAAPGMNRTAETNSILQGASSDGDGVLHIAASHGHVELTRAVFHALRPDPNVAAAAESSTEAGETTRTVRFSEFLRARNHKGETCLHEAVRCGHKELVALLVSEDARLDDDESSPALVQIADDEGVSPLYLASTLRRTDIVRVLTDKQRCRYSPSYSGPGGKTALHAAVLSNKELTEQLLDWNKDLINTADESGSTPLHFVASTRHDNIAKLLLEKDSDSAYCPDSKGSLPIHVAAAEGRLDMIKRLLQECPDCMWSLDASGRSFLHVAVEKRQDEVVAYVCKKKCPARFFNIRDKEGNTALHLAVRNGNQSVFCSLIRKNEVHLSLTNKEGHTPLDLAALSLPSGLRYRQTPREWILYDLILAGADFGTCRRDHFTSKITKPDKEKHSEAISKSAGLGAVCTVLILTVAFAAPFNVAKFYIDPSGGASHQASSRSKTNRARQHAFRVFIISDAMAFAFSASATFMFTFAGFPIVDRRARFHYLNTASACLYFAGVSMVAVFMLGVFVVVAPVDVPVAIVACVFALLVIIPHGTAVAMMLTHSAALCQRLGFLPWLRALFQSDIGRCRNRLPYYRLGSLSAVMAIMLFCSIVLGLSFIVHVVDDGFFLG